MGSLGEVPNRYYLSIEAIQDCGLLSEILPFSNEFSAVFHRENFLAEALGETVMVRPLNRNSMAGIPDRELVRDALKRLSSVCQRILRTLFSLGLVLVFVLIALVIAVYVFDPLLFHAVADSPQDVFADEAQVFESTTTALGCAPNATGNASVDGYQLLGAHHLVVTGNVTLPDASYVLTTPTVVERSDDEFVIAVESRPTNGSKRGCRGLVRYTAKIRLPYGATDYELVVRHGNNQTLHVVAQT